MSSFVAFITQYTIVSLSWGHIMLLAWKQFVLRAQNLTNTCGTTVPLVRHW